MARKQAAVLLLVWWWWVPSTRCGGYCGSSIEGIDLFRVGCWRCDSLRHLEQNRPNRSHTNPAAAATAAECAGFGV